MSAHHVSSSHSSSHGGSVSNSSNVVGTHYRVGKKIGEGSFGVIFEGPYAGSPSLPPPPSFPPRPSSTPRRRQRGAAPPHRGASRSRASKHPSPSAGKWIYSLSRLIVRVDRARWSWDGVREIGGARPVDGRSTNNDLGPSLVSSAPPMTRRGSARRGAHVPGCPLSHTCRVPEFCGGAGQADVPPPCTRARPRRNQPSQLADGRHQIRASPSSDSISLLVATSR